MVLKILYWLAVMVVSLALLVALVLFFESRDDSSLDQGSTRSGTLALLDAEPAGL